LAQYRKFEVGISFKARGRRSGAALDGDFKRFRTPGTIVAHLLTEHPGLVGRRTEMADILPEAQEKAASPPEP
jgi:hypothetical protein